MTDSLALPFRKRRGLDPHWTEYERDWSIIAARSSCESVLDIYCSLVNIEGEIKDCLRNEVKIAGKAWARAVFLFQLIGSDWTHIQPLVCLVNPNDAEEVSKRLQTTSIHFGYADTMGEFYYSLYENANCIECSEYYLEASSSNSETMLERTFRELNLYIPCQPWLVTPKTKLPSLLAPWTKADMAAAKVFLLG